MLLLLLEALLLVLLLLLIGSVVVLRVVLNVKLTILVLSVPLAPYLLESFALLGRVSRAREGEVGDVGLPLCVVCPVVFLVGLVFGFH